MEISRQEISWGELPFPPPGDLPDPGIKPMSLKSPALACGLLFFFFKSLPLPGKSNLFLRKIGKLKSTVLFLLFRSNWKKQAEAQKGCCRQISATLATLFHPSPPKEDPTH